MFVKYVSVLSTVQSVLQMSTHVWIVHFLPIPHIVGAFERVGKSKRIF